MQGTLLVSDEGVPIRGAWPSGGTWHKRERGTISYSEGRRKGEGGVGHH